MAAALDGSSYVTMARVERDLTGGVTLHLIHDDTPVEIHQGDEFLTVLTNCDPFTPPLVGL